MKQDKDHIHLLVNVKLTYSLGQTISIMKIQDHGLENFIGLKD